MGGAVVAAIGFGLRLGRVECLRNTTLIAARGSH